MSVDTDYWDVPFFPGMGGATDPDTPVITFPVNGLTVPPVHNVTGTAKPGQTVELWSAVAPAELAKHSEVVADGTGRFTFTGEQITGKDGDVATFEVRTDTGTSTDVTVTVRGPVVTGITPTTAVDGEPGTFVLQGSQFLTMTRTMQVHVVQADGATVNVDPDTITATEVTFTATLTPDGTAAVGLVEGGTGHTMTAKANVTVAPAAQVLAVKPGDVVEDVAHDDESVEPDPATGWNDGESALFSDGEYHWDGAGWLEGPA